MFHNEEDDEIAALVEELEELHLRLDSITARMRVLGGRRGKGSDGSMHDRRKGEKAKGKEEVLKRGQRIRMRNPTKKQPVAEGKVTRYYSNGMIEVELDDGLTTCRKRANLILLEK